METGQTFTVDKQAVTEMAKFYKRSADDESLTKLEGATFSIAKSKVAKAVTKDEVRGTKWSDGKPQRGRPRKFPRSTVARLLNELDDESLTAPANKVEESAEKTEEAELDQAADALVGASTAAKSESESGDEDW